MNTCSAAEITRNYVSLGQTKTRYPKGKTLLLALYAGMVIAFAAAVTSTATHAVANVGLARLISGLLFPFGLGIIVVTGGELFTGSSLLVIPLLARQVVWRSVLRNWLLIYAGNLLGGLLVAAGCALFGQLGYSQNLLAVYTIKLAAAKCAIPPASGLVMGVFCNLLVCSGVVMSLSAQDTTGKIIGAYLPVALFVICGFEHCVANMYYIPAGLFALSVPTYATQAAMAGVATDALTWGNYLLRNLLPVTAGNMLGGAALGAMMWVCHLRHE